MLGSPTGAAARTPKPASTQCAVFVVRRMLKVLAMKVTPNEDPVRVTDAVGKCKQMTQRICTSARFGTRCAAAVRPDTLRRVLHIHRATRADALADALA